MVCLGEIRISELQSHKVLVIECQKFEERMKTAYLGSVNMELPLSNSAKLCILLKISDCKLASSLLLYGGKNK